MNLKSIRFVNQSEQWLLARCRILQLASSCCLSEAVSDKGCNGRCYRSVCTHADTVVTTSVRPRFHVADAIHPPLKPGGQPALSGCGSAHRGSPLPCDVNLCLWARMQCVKPPTWPIASKPQNWPGWGFENGPPMAVTTIVGPNSTLAQLY